MHKNWVIKGYDQCVTCLADDPQNLGTLSSTLRTPGILSQTNNSIHKQSSKDARIKLKQEYLTRKFNLRTPVCKKESNQSEQRNSNFERNKIRLLIWTKFKFYSSKILFKLFKQKEGFKTNIQALESPNSDKRAKR